MKTKTATIASFLFWGAWGSACAYTVPTETRQESMPSIHATGPVAYSCADGKNLSAIFYKNSRGVATVEVILDTKESYILPQVKSGSGARYANIDETLVFWIKGKTATLVDHNNSGKNYLKCASTRATLNTEPDIIYEGVYENKELGFSLRLPEGYNPETSYNYLGVGVDKPIRGVKFAIPQDLAKGTNLKTTSYISVETLGDEEKCRAERFLGHPQQVISLSDSRRSYSVALMVDAGAGNRFEETVFAIPDSKPCMGVRYYLQWGNIAHYPTGAVKEFDKKMLIEQFDSIRRSLTLK
jgi:membrane-bound inhibitor of C-type lysozyme